MSATTVDRDRTATRTGSLRRRRTWTTVAWVVAMVALTAVILYPLAWMVSASFKPTAEFGANQAFLPENPTIGNYFKVLEGVGGVPLWRFFLNSFILASLSVVGIVISASLAAYAFARIRFRGNGAWFAVMIGTLLLPFHVLIIPQYMLFRRLDLVDTFVPLLLGSSWPWRRSSSSSSSSSSAACRATWTRPPGSTAAVTGGSSG